MRARIMPVDEQLREIAGKKAKLVDDYVIRNMPSDHYKELQYSFEQEEVRLRAIRSGIDPASLEDLEATRNTLLFWESQLKSMDWNLEDEDGQMVRTVDMPHDNVLNILGIDSKEMSDALQFPATKRELLDKLQVKLVVFHDRVDINAVFPINPIIRQKCTSTSQREGEEK